MAYDYLLFDLDGTLTDPKEGITKCVRYALESFGIPVEDLSELLCFIGPPLVESFMTRYSFSPEQAEAAVKKYRERFATVGIRENNAMPGMRELLCRLWEQGKTLCVATSKPLVFAREVLDLFDMTRFFAVISGAELNGRRSRKAEVIRDVFAQLNLREQDLGRCVMIGDRRQDVEGALECGIDSIGVRFGYAEPGELEQAGVTRIAADPEELEACICACAKNEKPHQ